MKDSSISVLIAKAKTFMTWARRNKIAVQEIEWPRLKQGERRVRFLTPDDEARILTELDPNRAVDERQARQLQDSKDFFVGLLDTACRLGELSIVQWRDVDIDAGTIQLYRPKVKNRSVIHVTKRFQNILRRRYVERVNEFVFADDRGRSHRQRPNRSIVLAIRRAGLKNFHLHDVRHAAVARLIQGGMTLFEVSKILGHSSIAMSERYAFLEAEDVTRKAKKILDDAQEGIWRSSVSDLITF
jgi:integrase